MRKSESKGGVTDSPREIRKESKPWYSYDFEENRSQPGQNAKLNYLLFFRRVRLGMRRR